MKQVKKIEPLKVHFRDYEDGVVGTEPPDNQKLMDKINEIIEAVNELDTTQNDKV